MLRIAFALLIAGATSAAAGEFTVKNCTSHTITIGGFNANDEFRIIHSSVQTVDHGQTGRVQCLTSGCLVLISGSLPLELFGPYDSARCAINDNGSYEVQL